MPRNYNRTRKSYRGGSVIGDSLYGAYSSAKKTLSDVLGYSSSPDASTMMPTSASMMPASSYSSSSSMPSSSAGLQNSYSLGPSTATVGGRGRKRVRMAHSGKNRRRRFMYGGGNVTPYSSDIWSQVGDYPKTVGGRRKHRKQNVTRRRRHR